jgi:hypothetical protein
MIKFYGIVATPKCCSISLSVHLKSGLMIGMAFGGNDLIRGGGYYAIELDHLVHISYFVLFSLYLFI